MVDGRIYNQANWCIASNVLYDIVCLCLIAPYGAYGLDNFYIHFVLFPYTFKGEARIEPK